MIAPRTQPHLERPVVGENTLETSGEDVKLHSFRVCFVAGWCEQGVDGCTKPRDCRIGQSYDYYLFTLENPLEVLINAAVPVLRELDPISMIKVSQKAEVNREWVDEYGIAQYKTLSSTHLQPHQV